MLMYDYAQGVRPGFISRQMESDSKTLFYVNGINYILVLMHSATKIHARACRNFPIFIRHGLRVRSFAPIPCAKTNGSLDLFCIWRTDGWPAVCVCAAK